MHELDSDAVDVFDERGVVALRVARVLLGLADRCPPGLERDGMKVLDLLARRHREGDVLPADTTMTVRGGVVIPGVEDDLGLVAVVPRDGVVVRTPALISESGEDGVELRPAALEVADGDTQVIQKSHTPSLPGAADVALVRAAAGGPVKTADISWNDEGMTPRVVAVHSHASHTFSKPTRESITLLEGLGVEGDAHCGATVQHRSRVAADPSQPNLRQVHLIPEELFDELRTSGHDVAPGQLGENITTRGVDVLALPVGARLRFGDAVVTITGLRNPCQQINGFQSGLLKQLVRTDDEGRVVRLAGVMGIVSRGGPVVAGGTIEVELPPTPHFPLTRV